MGSKNIQEFMSICKSQLDHLAGDWALFALILLASIGSFGLGRLSVLEAGKPLISISQAAVAAESFEMALGGEFVASRTGAVYYYPWCAGVDKIQPANRRWFATEKQAQEAGYRAAKNCKGLQ
jgi:hypothetical protein